VKRALWREDDGWSVGIIDQTLLPHRLETVRLTSAEDAAEAIVRMLVRGAPLIGITAAYGLALALRRDAGDGSLEAARRLLLSSRPTAVNLAWALAEVAAAAAPLPPADRAAAAYAAAERIEAENEAINAAIGRHGLTILERIAAGRGGRVDVITHCNAGWLATNAWGTATAPVYMAHEAGIAVHVWVDETRPRSQGAKLTAWELGRAGVAHTVIPDTAAGHVMREGLVDMAIVGTDRTTAAGDVANKIGTYQQALAARDNGVPFYVALPSPTIDWSISDGGAEIPIEQRGGEEVSVVTGRTGEGVLAAVEITPAGARVANYAFDVTPARLITGLITERGIAQASREGLARLFPDRAGPAA
jgi:methylthioribose-1-phosphate isomerase